MLDFKWPTLIQKNPSHRNLSLRCNFHRDHGQDTNRCRSLKFMVERLIRVRNLRRYIKEVDREEEPAPTARKITIGIVVPPEPRSTINYILGGSVDD